MTKRPLFSGKIIHATTRLEKETFYICLTLKTATNADISANVNRKNVVNSLGSVGVNEKKYGDEKIQKHMRLLVLATITNKADVFFTRTFLVDHEERQINKSRKSVSN